MGLKFIQICSMPTKLIESHFKTPSQGKNHFYSEVTWKKETMIHPRKLKQKKK